MELAFTKATLIMLVLNLAYAFLALVLGVAALKFIDWVFLRKIDLEEEIKKGNIAAAIFGASLLLFVALLIERLLTEARSFSPWGYELETAA